MSERYYRYNLDDAPIDIEKDELYDYVLEREKLHDLDNTGPRCMTDFKDMDEILEKEEHFGNLNYESWTTTQKILLAIAFTVILYLIYSLINKNDLVHNEYKPSGKNDFFYFGQG